MEAGTIVGPGGARRLFRRAAIDPIAHGGTARPGAPARAAAARGALAPALVLAPIALAAFALPPFVPAAFALPASAPAGSPVFAQAPDRQRPSAEAPELESETHELVNRHRRAAGLTPLRSDPAIAAIARRHSEAMATGRIPFGHDDAGGRQRRIERSIPLEAMAENVAVNNAPARRAARMAVSGWLGSAGHRANIEGGYDTTGIGVARSRRGAWHFTQIFVKRARGRPRRTSD